MGPISNIKPMLCRELVGRERELQELLSCLEQAASGQPGVVLIAGEAGLGKSRLCRVFMERSRALPVVVLLGQAIRQTAALPFGPFLDALRRYFTTSTDASLLSAPVLQAAFAPLVSLLPELAPLLPESALTLQSGMHTPLQQQQVLFHHVLSGLQSLVQVYRKPLLLVLEDLHWADETSLELLAFLTQGLNRDATAGDASPSLLIVGTYRSEVLLESPALQRLLVQLLAQRQISELHLTPLNAAEHWRCINSILEQPVSEEFATFLFAWDEGNPFFIEELLGAMANSGQLQMQHHSWLIPPSRKLQLPPSLTAAILERYVMLDPADQEVLAYASVIGRSFDFLLLAALCKLEERELVEVLRRAVLAQLISEVGPVQSWQRTMREPERYQFRHALTREAIYDQMLLPERRLRHAAVAETLVQLTMDTPDNRNRSMKRVGVTRLLAEHYWQAGLFEQARPYALREAERASQIFAFHEERDYLMIAQVSLPEDSLESLRLLQRLGLVSMGIFDFSDALHWLGLARSGYQRIGDQLQELQVLANIMLASWFLSDQSLLGLVAEVETATEVALANTVGENVDVEALVALSLIAQYWNVHCQLSRATLWIERSLTLSKSVTDPRKEAATQISYIARGFIKFHQSATGVEEGIVEIRNAINVAYPYSLPDVIMIGYTTLALNLIYWGRNDEAEQVLEETTDFEARSGMLRPSFLIGWQRFFEGEQWEQGIQLLLWDIERLKRLDVPYLVATERVALAHLLLARNDLAAAQAQLEAAQPILESRNEYVYLSPLWWGFAKLHAAQRDTHQVAECYERLLSRWKASEDTCLINPIALDAIAFYASTGELIKARQWLVELDQIAHKTANPVAVAALWESQGVMKAREGSLGQAIQALRQAVESWKRLNRRYQQALASQRLAEVLLIWARRRTVGRVDRQAARAEAETLLDMAFAVYEDLSIPLGKAEVQALRARTQLEAQRKRRRTYEARLPQAGLTQREMQILAQMAAGHTNREIATAMNLSVGTVGVHVSHILTKLNCATRTQAVSYALSKGWVRRAEET